MLAMAVVNECVLWCRVGESPKKDAAVTPNVYTVSDLINRPEIPRDKTPADTESRKRWMCNANKGTKCQSYVNQIGAQCGYSGEAECRGELLVAPTGGACVADPVDLDPPVYVAAFA